MMRILKSAILGALVSVAGVAALCGLLFAGTALVAFIASLTGAPGLLVALGLVVALLGAMIGALVVTER
jgi:hypothetical protein